MYEKLDKIAKTLRSGLFVDVWSVLWLSLYAIPGIYKYSKTDSLVPFFTAYFSFTLIVWFCWFAISHFKENFNYLSCFKMLPRLFIVSFFFCGYILNYKYSTQSMYRYALPVYCLTFMSICTWVSRKIYSIKIKNAIQADV